MFDSPMHLLILAVVILGFSAGRRFLKRWGLGRACANPRTACAAIRRRSRRQRLLRHP